MTHKTYEQHLSLLTLIIEARITMKKILTTGILAFSLLLMGCSAEATNLGHYHHHSWHPRHHKHPGPHWGPRPHWRPGPHWGPRPYWRPKPYWRPRPHWGPRPWYPYPVVYQGPVRPQFRFVIGF